LVRDSATASSVVTQAAVGNAVRCLAALGGSTNAVLHLTAMARRLGRHIEMDDFDAVSRTIPVIADLEPTGTGLMEDFDRSGGMPTLMRSLGDLLDQDVVLADGRRVADVADAAPEPDAINRSVANPVDAGGAFRVVRGNLAPDGALIKRSAASQQLLSHRGPALVLRPGQDVDERASKNNVTKDTVLVLAGAGPVGGPGMPEWGMVDIPKDLLDQGVTDMVRVSDARMSGTSFGTVFLHVAPEAAVGGPLALVRDGDMIVVDADQGLIKLEVDDAELAARNADSYARSTSRGYLALYEQHVIQAPGGCDFDFLIQPDGETVELDEPYVGRS